MNKQIKLLREVLFRNPPLIMNKPNTPTVNPDKCTGCGICAVECCSFTIEIKNDKAVHTDNTYCVDCGHCVSVCPAGAVEDSLASEKDYYPFDSEAVPDTKILQTLFKTRRSVRNYKDTQVPQEILEQIIEGGRYAPTGGNRPEVHYIVFSSSREVAELRGPTLKHINRLFSFVTNPIIQAIASMVGAKEDIKATKFYQPWVEFSNRLWKEHQIDNILYNAPAAIIVYGKKMDDTIPFSCAIALHQASLIAHTLGLGCCYNGFLALGINGDSKLKKSLGIPRRYKCFGAMTLGYPKFKYTSTVRRREAQVTWR
jgi:nitroreductase/Pyruvate/2-oxoacid:ferredoxin oxidoreductase delta subunit